jgi:hypothetical protein
MPHAAIKLVGSVNTQETAALNENSGISQSNLIRFVYDPNGITLAQKLGGWVPFYYSREQRSDESIPMPTFVRALWAWEDLNVTAHLAVGTDTLLTHPPPMPPKPPGRAYLYIITNNVADDITPTINTDNISPIASTANGSAIVTIQDTTVIGITEYVSVYIATPISIGGVVLFGFYVCDPNGFIGADSYTVQATNILGEPWLATTTVPLSAASLPVFTVTNGEININVNLPNYTYSVGDTFAALVPTTVGGLVIYGSYIVTATVDANNFTILSPLPAVATVSATMNNGNARFIYSFGQGTIPGGQAFGQGAFGAGGFGSGVPVQPGTGYPVQASDWTLDNWGDVLIACAEQPLDQETPFSPIYAWPVGAHQATVITNAPPVNDGIFVAMPQRQIVAWGSTETGIQDPLLLSWCDVGNYNQWIPLVTNQAGQYRIPKGSKIVGAVQGPQQAIIWTDIDCWSMQYIGPPYVYSFNEIGTGCGLIARKAAASMNGIYYWMGPSQFFTLSGNGVQPMPCPVWDVIFQNLNKNQLQKIRVAVNSRFNEIQWFYPSSESTENDSYVKYNMLLNLWDYGSLGRTAWIDQSVLGPPIGANAQDLDLYQHETSNDADGAAMTSWFQTGYFALAEGDVKAFVDWVWPDMKWGMYEAAQTAQVQISFYVVDYPGQTPTIYGPYTVTEATEYFYTRFRGRLVSIRIGSSDLGSFWRIGLLRYRYSVDGKI